MPHSCSAEPVLEPSEAASPGSLRNLRGMSHAQRSDEACQAALGANT